MMTLDAALQQFEATEANLAKLESLWMQIEQLQPSGPAFGSPPEYEELCLAFRRVLPGLPAIDGFRITDCLHDYDEAGQMHLDAAELGEIEVQVFVDNALGEQGRVLREYRFRLQAKRRELVRSRFVKLIGDVDALLRELRTKVEGRESSAPIRGAEWERLQGEISEIDILIGADTRPSSWGDLQRLLGSGLVGDLSDIVTLTWPAVKKALTAQLYGQHDPVPVATADLGEIVAAAPTGPVATKLDWKALTDEDFERLLFSLICEASGYENPEWLQKTHAPDRGRDLSVVRVVPDSLGNVRRHRTIIQCKHWLTRSVGQGEVEAARSQMELWEPPRVDVLVLATSGRFTADAIALVEKHNQADRALNIEMWPDSHLEKLLAARPHLLGLYGLRRS